jgi:uncharacterized membrane protein
MMNANKLKYLVLLFCVSQALPAKACISCNKLIRDGIYNSAYYPNLVVMLSAFIVLSVIVIILMRISTVHYQRSYFVADNHLKTPVPLTTSGIVLGIGIGGFLDGIILHQVLQWHEMLSAKVPSTDYINKSINMFWDGIFHFYCLIVVCIGLALLWKLLKRKDVNTSGKLLAGGMLMGWGLFNLIEGIMNHYILNLHNVIESTVNHHTANHIFLASSVVIFIAGYIWVRKAGYVLHYWF